MSNIKDKLFSGYNKDRLTVVNMAFVLLVRCIGYVLLVFFILCLIVGGLIPALLSTIRAFMEAVLWEKWHWRFAGEWAQAITHEIDKRILKVIDVLC